MPETVTPYLAGVWICVGFCAGFGWALGTVLVARLTR